MRLCGEMLNVWTAVLFRFNSIHNRHCCCWHRDRHCRAIAMSARNIFHGHDWKGNVDCAKDRMNKYLNLLSRAETSHHQTKQSAHSHTANKIHNIHLVSKSQTESCPKQNKRNHSFIQSLCLPPPPFFLQLCLNFIASKHLRSACAHLPVC